ncbi:uncharacterized protein LOC131007996 [Salvia miltiorrhiza]|uniref:uncharacterized protein LOC131007996 n=1 Tax=Salvia miltiorrhiza TaxID=226208 RepID=UPI0025AC0DD8|nr:uncharacterized protein LOC131007996 [Salvia miltiorrhiza]
MGQIVTDRNRKASIFRRDMMVDLGCEINVNQAHRAKKVALQNLEGNSDMQYAKLWEYSKEIRRTNPGSTAFKFCRPIIGIDGCHLKGPYHGIMLTAVGMDANNGIYPIAKGVVSNECKDTWGWFLVVLKQDLGIEDDSEYTFMSDKQKCLIQAMSFVFPNARNVNIDYARMDRKHGIMVRFQTSREISTTKWRWRICPRIKQLLENNVGKRQKRDDFVHECYSVETFKKIYAASIIGVSGPQLWNDSMYIPPLPPRMEKGKGKQSMARRKTPDEAAEKKHKKKTKLRRRQYTVTCSKCGIGGNNAKGRGKKKGE